MYNPGVSHPVDNSHYIAKHLTRPWEFTDDKGNARQLWFFDFDRDRFDVEAARTLYTRDEPWALTVEQFLNRHLEDPLAKFLNRFRRDRSAEPKELELRAMKATLMLQVERTQNTIHEVVEKGEQYLNDLVMAADVVFDFVHVPLKQKRLMFPESGFFVIPMLGCGPLLAMPFDSSYFMVAVPKPSRRFIKTIVDLRETPDTLSGLSMGFDKCRRVVVPGNMRGSDERAMAHMLKWCREAGKLWAQATMRANIQAWGVPFPKPFTMPRGLSVEP